MSGRELPWFAVLDPARDARIYPAMKAMAPDARCLFEGPLHPRVERVSPHVFAFAPGSHVAAWWRDAGRGGSWGIFLRADADLNAVRRHLRRLLRVQLPDRRWVLLRFYDPRVLGPFLRSCGADQLPRFFGPVRRFVTESEDGGLVAFSLRGGALTEGPVDGAPGRAFDSDAAWSGPALRAFSVSHAQVEALEESVGVKRLAAKLGAHFSRIGPAWAMQFGRAELDRRMELGVQRARDWGFRSEYGVGVFVAGMLTCGPNFDRVPAFRAVLSDPALDEAAKLRAFDSRELAPRWADAAAHGMEWE